MTSRTNLRLVAGGSIALLVASILQPCSVDAAETLAQRFARYDTNSDGEVSREELPAVKVFQLLDRNGDGSITLAETRVAIAVGALRGVNLPKPVARRVNEIPSADSGGPVSKPKSDSDRVPISDDIRQAARPIQPNRHGVGRLVANVEFTDIQGQTHRLSDLVQGKVLVIAMTGTGCPLCQKYAPTLAAIEQQYRDRDVAFLFVNPNESESTDKLRESIRKFGLQGIYVRDTDDVITRALEVKTTTETFVLDAARTLVYRGAVDDQYGFGYTLDSPRHSYLVDALDSVLHQQRPEIAATTSPGCEIFYDKPNADTVATSQPPVTYHARVSRILQDNCQECHRETGVAPFPLESYQDAKDYALMIANVVRREVMPPWFAASEQADDSHFGVRWANDRSLAHEDRDALIQWAQSGAPQGDPADAPLPATYDDDWSIGTPHAVVQIPQPFQVQATGQMPYRHARVRTQFEEDRWVQAVEIQPTDSAVVHHVLVFVQDGDQQRLDEEAGFFAAYVPGNTFQKYPRGTAKKLPAGANLVFQIHYTPNGEATSDQTRLGIVFAEEPPQRMIRNVGISNHRISIPPGADNHSDTASLRIPTDVQILALMPHMHVRGKAFRFDVVTPDGNRKRLLEVPRYDFNWQLEYRLAQPLSISRGSQIEVTGWFDNSEANPANPDPTRTVRWGPQTDDEMLLGYVEYYVPTETLPK